MPKVNIDGAFRVITHNDNYLVEIIDSNCELICKKLINLITDNYDKYKNLSALDGLDELLKKQGLSYLMKGLDADYRGNILKPKKETENYQTTFEFIINIKTNKILIHNLVLNNHDFIKKINIEIDFDNASLMNVKNCLRL
jgi:hypothetical protein